MRQATIQIHPRDYSHDLWLLRPSQCFVRNDEAVKFVSSTEASAGENELVLGCYGYGETLSIRGHPGVCTGEVFVCKGLGRTAPLLHGSTCSGQRGNIRATVGRFVGLPWRCCLRVSNVFLDELQKEPMRLLKHLLRVPSCQRR